MVNLKTVFDNFSGHWSFDRMINSLDGVKQGHASGQARFNRLHRTGQLDYHENGHAIYYPDNQQTEFFRDYTYHLNEDLIDVYHKGAQQDGQLYQSYYLDNTDQTLRPRSDHICAADIYHGVYNIINADCFTLTTYVTGPAKDHLITTTFTRLVSVADDQT